jgi:2-polyprenyl-3-methyl-5-hydroxy-6-metoxy-1,4-benzoquinol methylase
MRYRIQGHEIRSENAAKPASSASQWLLTWINGLPRQSTCLDLGCGKLRYTTPLAKRVRSVTAVDSRVQVDRIQRVGGEACSIRDYVRKHISNARVYAFDEVRWRSHRYDFVVCSNVMSAIPCLRTRKQLMTYAKKCLKPTGRLLITTQFRNSHFKSWRTNPNAKPYLDGFIVRSRGRASFYGLLDAKDLVSLCNLSGFRILEFGHIKELAYVLAKSRPRSRPKAI